MKQDKKREELASVFIEMLNDTPLESLRIQDLCDRAGVSKSTFYRLFTDKYDLSFWIVQKHTHSIVVDKPSLNRWGEWTQHNYENMIKYKAYYRNIASYRGQNCLYDYLAQYYRQNILKFRRNPHKELTEDQKYAVRMMSLVNAQITIDWILEGFESSPETIYHRASLCIPECIRELYE